MFQFFLDLGGIRGSALGQEAEIGIQSHHSIAAEKRCVNNRFIDKTQITACRRDLGDGALPLESVLLSAHKKGFVTFGIPPRGGWTLAGRRVERDITGRKINKTLKKGKVNTIRSPVEIALSRLQLGQS